jgi:squalene/oxidosqualene cyclase-like protein
MIQPVLPTPTTAVIPDALQLQAEEAMSRALGNLAQRQEERGSWAGDYGGPMFLMPMYLALCHVAGKKPDAFRTQRMTTYFFNVQRADGSLGLHAEATEGSMFTTALGYAALRILGLSADDARMRKMAKWIRENGTPLGAASWGKFTLCLLGLYDWKGIHPVLPELWLLPVSAPMHPGKLWCHCRQVYLPMAWLYGTRSTGTVDSFIRSLRDEMYGANVYDKLEWEKQRDTVCREDDYRPGTRALQAVNFSQGQYERLPFKPLRKRALEECLKHIRYEDKVTNDLDIGPVNAVFNTIVHHFRGGDGADDFRRGFAALDVYLWDGHDGMKMQGYNNSELWDLAFALQAVLAVPERVRRPQAPMIHNAYRYLRDNQILDDVPEAELHYRHLSKGGWPFSNRAHGWPITDCTSEGLKCALLLEGKYPDEEIPLPRLRDAVRLLLSWQNEDGGWSTYERQRAGAWIEELNPSQVFGDIMVDYSHVECTSACIQGLMRARARFRGEFDEIIDVSVARGLEFLRGAQKSDGSFEGAWAVCFTYGTWFGVTALRDAGVSARDPSVRSACEFLLSKQKSDGSWGEAGDSCRDRKYIQHEKGQVAQTSWALLALVRGGCDHPEAMRRAAEFLINRQERDGSWARESLVGVFNRTCLINYDNYRHYFPLWALAEWSAAQRQDG